MRSCIPSIGERVNEYVTQSGGLEHIHEFVKVRLLTVDPPLRNEPHKVQASAGFLCQYTGILKRFVLRKVA